MADDFEQPMPDESVKEEPASFSGGGDSDAIGKTERTRERLSAALDALYKRLPKIIARLREGASDDDLLASLKKLLTSFKKINETEKKLLPSQQLAEYQDINLLRIYELAEQGGGNVGELENANAAFAEENAALVDTIEGLTFEISSLRRQAADEILGKEHLAPLQGLDQVLKDVASTLTQIDASIGQYGLRDQEQPSTKGLDERILEGILGISPISAELLAATPAHVTFLGGILRKFGLAYDHKDISAIRQLVISTLAANRKLAEALDLAAPSGSQIEKIAHFLSIIELYMGHEEREGLQYKEAMAEVDRLQKRVAAYDEKHGSIEQLEQRFQERQAELEDIERRLHEIMQPIHDLQEEHTALKKAFESEQTEKTKLQASVRSGQLTIEELKQANATQAHTMIGNKLAYQQELAVLKNRIHALKSGLLVERLEAEIMALRSVLQPHQDEANLARAEKEAFASRVESWVSNEDTLRKDAKRWRKLAQIKLGFGIAAVLVTGTVCTIAGSVLASAHAHLTQPLYWYFGPMIGSATVLGGIIGAVRQDSYGRRLEEGLKYAGIFAAAGTLLSALGIPSYEAAIAANKSQYERQLHNAEVHFVAARQPSLPTRQLPKIIPLTNKR